MGRCEKRSEQGVPLSRTIFLMFVFFKLPMRLTMK